MHVCMYVCMYVYMYVNEICVAVKEDRVRDLMGDIKMFHSHARHLPVCLWTITTQ